MKLEGKVALVSGGARGQGRAHCVRLAREGARIVTFDVLKQIDSVAYPLSTEADLAQTVKLVEQEGQAIHAVQGDVRDRARIDAIVGEAVERFGRLDIVIANAGIMSAIPGRGAEDIQSWHDSIDVLLTGVFHTVDAAIPAIIAGEQGGSIVVTSSVAGLKGFPNLLPGGLGYCAAKHGVVGLMRSWAGALAPHSIRVNSIHPTGVNTTMIDNEAFREFAMTPDNTFSRMMNALPVQLLDPMDIANAACWLCTDEAQYLTGVTLPVDAGQTIL